MKRLYLLIVISVMTSGQILAQNVFESEQGGDWFAFSEFRKLV